MDTRYSMSKDDIYGPPPAYSLDPPPPLQVLPLPLSIYTITDGQAEYPRRSFPSSHISIILSSNFLRYLLGTGLLHVLIGAIAIICDILLISMNESYCFAGFWAGISCIILGIYLILFTNSPAKHKCCLHRLKFIHIAIGIILIVALVLSCLNLAANACSNLYFQMDPCEPSAQKFKIVLVTFFAFSIFQICITFILSFVHLR